MFDNEYHSMTAYELWRKYQDYKEGKTEKIPQTIGQWKQSEA